MIKKLKHIKLLDRGNKNRIRRLVKHRFNILSQHLRALKYPHIVARIFALFFRGNKQTLRILKRRLQFNKTMRHVRLENLLVQQSRNMKQQLQKIEKTETKIKIYISLK